VHVQRGGNVEITIVHDALAYALNDTSGNIDDETMREFLSSTHDEVVRVCDDARARIVVGTRLEAMGVVVDGRRDQSVTVRPSVVHMLSPESLEAWKRENPEMRLPCKLDAVLQAKLPAGATSMTIAFPKVLGEIVMMVDRPGLEALDLPLRAGEESEAIDVSMVWQRSSQPSEASQHESQTAPLPLPSASPNVLASQSSEDLASSPSAPDTQPVVTERSLLRTLWRYAVVGFAHIIPAGVDHVVFIVGLFLLSPKFKDAVLLITWFTLAHTTTLTLASLGLVQLSPKFIECAIAISIACIAIENLVLHKPKPWRAAIVFVFGLVHGLGVAGAFAQVGFDSSRLVTSLLGFTAGVEVGHIAALLACFALLGWTTSKSWYRSRVVVPISVCIAFAAIVWTVQRVTG
jgi:hypothetical protein